MSEAQGDPMTAGGGPAGSSGGDRPGGPPTEEELRAAYEAEIKKLRVEHLLLEHVVTLINLGSRRTGQAPGTEDERDPEQVRLAIESIRALLPVLEQSASGHVGQIREALAQLQLAFVKIEGQQAAPPSTEPEAAGSEQAGAEPGPGRESAGPGEGRPGPAQRSGRLWIPGQ